ncbi:MAG: trypsin-like peptidase domain-containing protein [Planctomycetes bacterium]|nr:trypsin-like peptidase domain-containing protein [Planctomycetota bacterium]
MRLLITLLVLSVLALTTREAYTIAEASEINTVLMESTFKIIGESALPGKATIGTVFVIVRPSNKNPEIAYYVLVTAAHVLEDMKGDHAKLVLRKKAADGTYKRVVYPVEIRRNGKPLWTHHQDSNVDVAAMYVQLPKYYGNKSFLPTTLLADDKMFKELAIHPGDEALCLGYPFGAEANEAGFPILRSGKIASYPMTPTKQTKTFLYTCEVFPGNSGGPV